MKTLLVSVKEKDSDFIEGLFKKLKISSKVLSDEELEEIGIAEAIAKGIKTEDVSKEKLLNHFRKHGVDC